MSLVKNFCNISRVIKKKKTELDYIYSQTTVKERKKEKYHLHADYSQICISSLDLSSELQTHMTICLLDIITWKPVRHLKQNTFKVELSISYPHPSHCQPCFSPGFLSLE